MSDAGLLLPNGRQTFLDANGDPLAGGSVTFYVPNTTTLKDTYIDPGLTTKNLNPITLDASGSCIAYGDGDYSQKVLDWQGNLIWNQLTAGTQPAPGSLTFLAGTVGGTGNATTLSNLSPDGFELAAGLAIRWLVANNNTGAVTLVINGGSAYPLVQTANVSGGLAPLIGGELSAGQEAEAVFDGTQWQKTAPTSLTSAEVGALTIDQTIKFNGVITPSALNANTNDWDPTGLSAATRVRASASVAVNLTGLKAASDGQWLVLENVGAYNITLTANDSASASANRFLFPKPLGLRPGDSVLLEYDGTAGGWRSTAVAGTQPVAGGFSGLKILVTSNTAVTLTALGLTLQDVNGQGARLQNLNISASTGISGAGGIDSGGVAASTWYAVWVIWNGAAAAILLSTSFTAPTLPTGYTFATRFGAVLTDASSNLKRTLQYGKEARYVIGTNPTAYPSIASGIQTSWFAVAVATLIPPSASAIDAFVNSTSSSGGQNVSLAPNNTFSTTPGGGTNPPPICGSGSTGSSGSCYPQASGRIFLESTSIYYYGSLAQCQAWCVGWEDNL